MNTNVPTTFNHRHLQIRALMVRVIGNTLRDAPVRKASEKLQVRFVEMSYGQLFTILDFGWHILSQGDKRVIRSAACEAALQLKLAAYETKSASKAWDLLGRAWALDVLACKVVDPSYEPCDRDEWIEAEMAA